MAAKDYRQLLEDLRAGKIEEFVVIPEEFMDFQPIYHDYEYRTQFDKTRLNPHFGVICQ